MVNETHKYRIKLQPPVDRRKKENTGPNTNRVRVQTASDPKTSISAISPWVPLGTNGYTIFSKNSSSENAKILAYYIHLTVTTCKVLCKTKPLQRSTSESWRSSCSCQNVAEKSWPKHKKRFFICKLCMVCMVCMVDISEMGFNIIQINQCRILSVKLSLSVSPLVALQCNWGVQLTEIQSMTMSAIWILHPFEFKCKRL